MPKTATKASDNEFYKARLAASSCNDRLGSREGASEETGIDRTRLARIELGKAHGRHRTPLVTLQAWKTSPQSATLRSWAITSARW